MKNEKVLGGWKTGHPVYVSAKGKRKGTIGLRISTETLRIELINLLTLSAKVETCEDQ